MIVGTRSKLLWCGALLAVPSVAAPLFAAAPAAAPVHGAGLQGTDTPDRTARDFYVWYVHLLAHDKEATDDPTDYARFVSRALRARIARQMASAEGMDVDYFIKAQDYLDGWLTHVTASRPVVHGSGADLIVTLGGGGEGQRLAVKLVREDARWKIAAVARA